MSLRRVLLAAGIVLGLVLYLVSLYAVFSLWDILGDPSQGIGGILGAAFSTFIIWASGGVGALVLVAASILSGSHMLRLTLAPLGLVGLGMVLVAYLQAASLGAAEGFDLVEALTFLAVIGWPYLLLIIPTIVFLARRRR